MFFEIFRFDRITSYNVCYTKLLRLAWLARFGGLNLRELEPLVGKHKADRLGRKRYRAKARRNNFV